MNFTQIRARLQRFNWIIGGHPIDLWGEGKALLPLDQLDFVINEAIMEWAIEAAIDQEVWELEDESGTVTGLTADQRKYALPADVGVIMDVRIAYDDSTEFRGYPVDLIYEKFLVNEETNTSAKTDRPERMFIWKDEFELDPVPDSAYSFRMYGFQIPETLTEDTDQPTPLDLYHRSLFLKCKLNVAMEIGDERVDRFELDYLKALKRVTDFDDRRHHAVRLLERDEDF